MEGVRRPPGPQGRTRSAPVGGGFPALLAAAMLLAVAPAVRGDEGGEPRGPAFSDPASRQEMPAEWVAQPVRPRGDGPAPDLAVDLNQQIYPALLPLVQEYAARHGLSIAVTKGTCGKSTALLGRKEVHIGSFCCPPAAVDRLPGLSYHTLGIMPSAILVHPSNPVTSLTWRQVQGIFAGEITDWSEVGGPPLRIKAIASFHCKDRPGDWHLLLANPDLFGPNILEVGGMPDMISHVSGVPGAIGYEVELVAETFADRGPVRALAIDGVGPGDLEALVQGRYPIYRTYNVTTWEGGSAGSRHAAGLVAFLMEQVERLDPGLRLIPASRLRAAGWKFQGDELVGEP